jgi:hypothetical protein
MISVWIEVRYAAGSLPARLGRRVSLTLGLLALTSGLLAAPALAGNEGAPWSAPDYLSPVGEEAFGPSLAMLADGSLVATWTQRTSDGTIPELASEPFAGAWSSPSPLSSKAITVNSPIGGVRTAVASDGQYVSSWVQPDLQSPAQPEIAGADGEVTPGENPSVDPHVFARQKEEPRLNEYTYGETPQVLMSSDGTGSVAYLTGSFTAYGEQTIVGLSGLAGGSPTGSSERQEEKLDTNPGGISGDFSNFIPALAGAGLNASWSASTNDERALVATSPDYEVSYGGVNAPGYSALLYTTSDPLAWPSTPEVVPLPGEDAAAAVLPNRHVLVASQVGSNLELWETGKSTPTVIDPDDSELHTSYPVITTYFDGSATIAYSDYGASLTEGVVKEVTMEPDGSLSEPVTLSEPGFSISDLTDAYGPDGTTYVVWAAQDSTEGGVYSSVRLSGGSFPRTPETVVTDRFPSYATWADPKIAVDETGFATIMATVEKPSAGAGLSVAAFTRANPILPTLLTAPQVTYSGSLVPGTVLTCTNGTWRGQPTSYTYTWLLDGSSISGATQQTFTVGSSEVGHQLSCQVIATNAAGSAKAQSAAVVPAAASPQSPATQTPTTPSTEPSAHGSGAGTAHVGAVSGGASVGVTLSCSASASSCAPLSLQLSVIEQISGGHVVAVTARDHAKKTRMVVIGSATVTLTPGQTKTVTVKLSKTGLTLLAAHPELSARLTIISGKTTLQTKSVRVTAPLKPHKHKQK